MHIVRRIPLLSLFCISCAVVGGVAVAEPSSAVHTAELTLPEYAFAATPSSIPLQWAQPLQATPAAAPQAPAAQGQWLRISDDGDTETAQQPQRPQRWVF